MIVRIQNVPLAIENLEVSTGHPKKYILCWIDGKLVNIGFKKQ